MDAQTDDSWLAITPPAPRRKQLPAPNNGSPQSMRTELAMLKRQMTPLQRQYVSAYIECGFSPRKAIERMRKAGFSPTRTSQYRWRQTPVVRRAMEVAEEMALIESNVSATRVLRRVNDIAEQAAETMPLTYKGEIVPDVNGEVIPVIKDAAAALKANELLGKRLRLWGDDETAGRVVVQVVNLTGKRATDAVDAEYEHVE